MKIIDGGTKCEERRPSGSGKRQREDARKKLEEPKRNGDEGSVRKQKGDERSNVKKREGERLSARLPELERGLLVRLKQLERGLLVSALDVHPVAAAAQVQNLMIQ